MLDAWEACSDATGRNGGHIKANPWGLFQNLAIMFRREKAEKVTEFRMGILDKMIVIVDTEGVIEECQIRKVEAVDVHFDAEHCQGSFGYLLGGVSVRDWEMRDVRGRGNR